METMKSGTGRPSKKKQNELTQTLSDIVDTGIIQKPEFTRTCFDLTKEEHCKLKMYSAKYGKPINLILREFIQSLPD